MSEVLSGCAVRAEIQRERADVKWLSPVLVRHQVKWPHQCEDDVHSEAARDYNKQKGYGLRRGRSARIDFKGRKLCLLHAKIAALQELAGPEPGIVLTTRSGASE